MGSFKGSGWCWELGSRSLQDLFPWPPPLPVLVPILLASGQACVSGPVGHGVGFESCVFSSCVYGRFSAKGRTENRVGKLVNRPGVLKLEVN